VPVAPVLPLVPEAVGATPAPIVLSATPPAITTPASASVAENAPLAVTLKANDGLVKWAITGGADAARFEIVSASGVYTLRWLGDSPKDYETPLDANGDNVYEAEVTATNPLGYASSLLMSVTVRDKVEFVVTPFTDNFNRAAEDLEISPSWLRVGGSPNRLVVAGNAVTIGVAGADAVYLSPDTGATNHYVQAAIYGFVAVAVSVTDEKNHIGLSRSGNNVVLVQRVGGVATTLGTWAGAGNATLRLEYSGGTATAIRNGVTLGAVAVSSGPPATTRAGVFVTGGVPTVAVLDDYAAGAL
jgi:hypothetical protein